jgi:hypothetical protein
MEAQQLFSFRFPFLPNTIDDRDELHNAWLSLQAKVIGSVYFRVWTKSLTGSISAARISETT